MAEDQDPLRRGPVAGELLTLLVRATELARRMGVVGKHYSLGAIVLAFEASPDPVSHWFRGYVANAALTTEGLLELPATLAAGDVMQVAESPVPDPDAAYGGAWDPPAADLLDFAWSLPAVVGEPREGGLGVRHLMGALIYGRQHLGAIKADRRQRERWSGAFRELMSEHWPEEAAGWEQLHRQLGAGPVHAQVKAAPAGTALGAPVPGVATADGRPAPTGRPDISSSGPSTHIATDRWTLDDALGYSLYAHALYRFLTHPETRAPLTVSVQAPWGGGKSSLMRMVQARLDPGAAAGAGCGQADGPDVGTVLAALDGRPGAGAGLGAGAGEPALPPIPGAPAGDGAPAERRATVWFNAWKYQNTEQVWAGLADCIVGQITDRLPPLQRELFRLRLQRSRLDGARLRREVAQQVQAAVWAQLRPWVWRLVALLAGTGATALTGWIAGQPWLQGTGVWAGAATVVAGALVALQKQAGAWAEAKAKPAASLAAYVAAPDYSSRLGFIHEVEADLRRVLALVPAEHRPVVVFVDDLDRCSPDKVAEVVQAVNLFLAGDFPDCLFVLGIDAEMVAAALEVAHEKVIAQLPPQDTDTPLGWRYMDKFVQLPFVVPPPGPEEVQDYLQGLLVGEAAPRAADDAVVKVALRVEERLADTGDDPDEAARAVDEEAGRAGLDQEQRRILTLETARLVMDRGINSFSDRDPRVRQLLLAAAGSFSRNPRELKRFVNVFRFQYFMRWARLSRRLPVPTEQQLARWITLWLRWPRVVRWLRQGRAAERLRWLEETAAAAGDAGAWAAALARAPGPVPWYPDGDLWQFFREGAPDLQLSRGAGQGLW